MEETTSFIPVIDNGKIADETGKIYDLTQTVSDAAIAFVMLSIVVSIALIVLLLVKFIKKNGSSFLGFIFGIIGYMYFGYIMYGLIVWLFSFIPGMKQFSIDYPVQRLIIAMTLSGLLCEFGKYITILIYKKKYDKDEDVLTMGVGYSLANMVSTIFYWIMTMTVMVTVNEQGGFIGIIDNDDPVTMLNYAKNYELLFTTPDSNWMYQGLFFVLFTAFNVYSIIIILGVYKNKLKFYYMFAISAVHIALTLINGFAGYDYIPYWIAFACELVIVMVSLRYIFFISKTQLGDMLKEVKSTRGINNGKNGNAKKAFPKFK